MKIFSIHDSKALAYMPPIFFKSAGEAIRAFSSSCEDQQSMFYKYPSDFTLVELGEYDEQTASIATHSSPRILSNASEYKKVQTPAQVTEAFKPLIDSLDPRN